MSDNNVQLSKWWKTESCARAFALADAKRRARLDQVRSEVAARKTKLDAECQALFEREHDASHFICLNAG